MTDYQGTASQNSDASKNDITKRPKTSAESRGKEAHGAIEIMQWVKCCLARA